MKIAQVRQFALSLPEVTEEPHFHFSSFRIRGKIFATVPPGDEFLHVFLDDEERLEALAQHPSFLEELPWGKRIIGVRVTLAKAKVKAIHGLLAQAWSRKAPKSLRE